MTEWIAEPALQAYAVCAALLVLKMWLTGNATGLLRVRRGVYITPEDYALTGKPQQAPDETIERLRRAHQNDLENVLPFLAVGALYASTGPSATLAGWLFGIFTAARVAHTVVYAMGLQPWRTIAFEVGNLALLVIVVHTIVRVL